jgi:hypothetical protein
MAVLILQMECRSDLTNLRITQLHSSKRWHGQQANHCKHDLKAAHGRHSEKEAGRVYDAAEKRKAPCGAFRQS